MKVVVIEDNVDDIEYAYKALVDPNYDLHICVVAPLDSSARREDVIFSATLEYLQPKGFDINKVYKGFNENDERIKDADAYFIDGLDGRVLEFITKLPLDKVYVSTSNEGLRQECASKGYQTIMKTPNYAKNTVDRLMKKR